MTQQAVLTGSAKQLEDWATSNHGRIVPQGKHADLNDFVVKVTRGYPTIESVAFGNESDSESFVQGLKGDGTLKAVVTYLAGPEFHAVNYDTVGRLVSICGGREVSNMRPAKPDDECVVVEFDSGVERTFVFVSGSDRDLVADDIAKLGIQGLSISRHKVAALSKAA